MEKIKLIAIVGRSGSGKDTLQKFLLNNIDKAHAVIQCTTRPMRDYEIDGEDYYFIDLITFTQKVLNGEMIEATVFNNDWFYGTLLSSLEPDKINIGIFNPQAFECIIEDPRLEVIPIYIDASDKNILQRLLDRKDNCDELCRRFLADKKDFKKYDLSNNYSMILFNNDGIVQNMENILSELDNFIK